MGVRTGANIFVRGKDVGTENFLSVPDGACVPGTQEEVGERLETDEMVELRIPSRVRLRRPAPWMVSWCAVGLHLKIWAEVCLEENLIMLLDACLTVAKYSKAGGVTDDVV